MTADASLPKDIKRPLQLASFAILAFLAFVSVWSATAQIATTVRVPGLIAAERPSHRIQHPRGGQIEHISIKLHDQVSVGDLLFQFDVTDQLLQRATLLDRLQLLNDELVEIEPRLNRRDLPFTSEAEITPTTASFVMQDVNLAHRISELRVRRDAAGQRLDAKLRENLARQELRDIAATRLARMEPLAESGTMSTQQITELRQVVLSSDAQIATSESQIVALEQEIAATSLRMQVLHSDHRKMLADQQQRHRAEIQEIEGRIARLDHLIANAEIHAPAAGQITELPFHAQGMVAGPGATLAVVAEPLKGAEISLQIPPNYIDQTFVGQSGLITIPGLPQRAAPILHGEILAIADEPVRDQNGTTMHYLARALIDADDIAAANGLTLTVGMPLSIALEGEKTTLLSYVTAPLTQILTGAFEN